MTAILKTSVVQNASSSTANITLDTSGGASIGNGVIASPSTMSLQTNGSTTGLYIDASQNVGIGTSSPTSKLQVYQNSAADVTITSQNAFSGYGATLQTNANSEYSYYTSTGATRSWIVGQRGVANGYFTIYDSTASTSRVAIDTSGNVGIGTSSPSSAKLQVLGTTGNNVIISQISGATNNPYLAISHSETGLYSKIDANGTTVAACNLVLSTVGSERMRIDSSGNLLVGTTSGITSGGFSIQPVSGQSTIAIGHITGTGSGQPYAQFYYAGTQIGSITQNGTTGVLYNITSDYRLKDNPTKITNGIETIQKLNPVNFTWKTDNSADSGFIAHEFQSVIPRSVTGEKDAVDANGKPVYQGMDNSGAIPYLVAAIQEQQATITALTARIATLEAK